MIRKRGLQIVDRARQRAERTHVAGAAGLRPAGRAHGRAPARAIRWASARRCRCSAPGCAPSRRYRCPAPAATGGPRRRRRRLRSSRRTCGARPRHSSWCRKSGCPSESLRTVRAHWSCRGSPRPPPAAARRGWHLPVAMLSFSGGWLEVVARPATSNASLMVMGTPCSGPNGLFALLCAIGGPRSLHCARLVHQHECIERRRSHRAIRSRCAFVASTELNRPFRMARAKSRRRLKARIHACLP